MFLINLKSNEYIFKMIKIYPETFFVPDIDPKVYHEECEKFKKEMEKEGLILVPKPKTFNFYFN